VTAVLLVALSVGLDNFAVAAAYGMTGASVARRLHLVLVFGLFAGGMPVLGLLLGARISGVLGAAAGPAAGGLLGLTGGYGLVTAIRDRRRPAAAKKGPAVRPMGPVQLWLAGLALSLDSLVVGVALGAYHTPLPLAVLVFAAAGTALPLLGLEVGRRAGAALGELGGLLGSVMLVLAGVALGTGLL
jgi:putative Mn2+ efflux pump MntP